MKPSAVAVDFGTPDLDYNLPRSDSSFGFEDVSYPPTHHWSVAPEEQQLPLYSMSEGEARRRVRTGATGGSAGSFDPYEKERYDDDEGKDKSRAAQRRISSGRVPQHHLPPPTSIVSRPDQLNLLTYLPSTQREFLYQNLEYIPPVIYTLLSCWTRFHKIGASNIVVWDEAHFGKFGSHYLKREFYFDVHPPLGKMLVGLAGLLSGYDGGFEFKSGEAYPESVPYVAMRVMLATFGVGMVPLAWYTALELGMSLWACHLTAMMVLLGAFGPFSRSVVADDDGAIRCRLAVYLSLYPPGLYAPVLHVPYRFLLDQIPQPTVRVRPVLQLIMPKLNLSAATFRSFSIDWWLWLSLTGFSIGCVTRCVQASHQMVTTQLTVC
jgi:dolichyl-phosphate-mannose-protein mannosyltransferase